MEQSSSPHYLENKKSGSEASLDGLVTCFPVTQERTTGVSASLNTTYRAVYIVFV
jgi:hypothetical protein